MDDSPRNPARSKLRPDMAETQALSMGAAYVDHTPPPLEGHLTPPPLRTHAPRPARSGTSRGSRAAAWARTSRSSAPTPRASARRGASYSTAAATSQDSSSFACPRCPNARVFACVFVSVFVSVFVCVLCVLKKGERGRLLAPGFPLALLWLAFTTPPCPPRSPFRH